MRNDRGMSLVELMVVLAIIAVVCGMALPSLIGMRGKRQLEAAVNDVQTAINLAKSTAIKYSSPTAILFKVPANGITVFTDSNGNGTREAGERLVRTIYFPQSVSLHTLPDVQSLNFDTRGFISSVGTPGLSSITITLERTQDARTPRIDVTATGSSRISWN